MKIFFDNRYVNLGNGFFVKTKPIAVQKPSLIKFNETLANNLGFSAAKEEKNTIAEIFSGNAVPEGAEPVAMAYAGHQFGYFVPQLGDGRALLLGEITNGDNIYGIHLKGSGQTVFSRNGDGRAALGPVLREYLLSEAMAKLGVPTTRALAAITTGEHVARERLLPGAVITRVATSFVRVGTFEYFRCRGNVEAVHKLADHIIKTYYPSLSQAKNPYAALLQTVVDRQAALIAQWMHLGFIHGVMNTDNMSITAETIDYGPCAFMDTYAHDSVYSSIDRDGRYAYGNQPSIGLWNLIRLAESLTPLLAGSTEAAVEIAQDILQSYHPAYEKNWLTGMRAKCGLNALSATEREDKALIEALLDAMETNNADFTLTFLHLSNLKTQPSKQDGQCRDLFDNPAQFDDWAAKWRQRLGKEKRDDKDRQTDMRQVNPVYIPRNHQVEAAIRAAEDRGDFSVFHELHDILQNPYEWQKGKEKYQLPPEPHEIVKETFCGT